MSLITFEAQHIDYEEWLRRNPDVALQEETCDDCDGTGVSECFHCGSEIECETCGGDGVINSAKEQYDQQVKHDKQVLRKYANWLTRAVEHRDEGGGEGAEETPKNLSTED